MSDAKVKQSVEHCRYRHEWGIPVTAVDGTSVMVPVRNRIECLRCGQVPNAKELKEAEAIVHLRSILGPGDTVYTVLRHVSRSGMTRGIDCYVLTVEQKAVNNGREIERVARPLWITAFVGHAIGQPQPESYWRKSMGLKIEGCGMDMGFDVVYNLGRALWPNGTDSYALKHEWL